MYDDYSYGMDSGLLLGVYLFSFFIIIIAYVINAWLLGTVYKKMGEEQWKAWVPVYNSWVFLERGGFHGALSLLSLAVFIPFLGSIISLGLAALLTIAAYNIGKGFNKEGVWAVLYFFLAPVWAGILGFGQAVYNPSLNPKDRKYSTATSTGVSSQNYQPPACSQGTVYAPPTTTFVDNGSNSQSNGYLPAERENEDKKD